MAQEYVGKYQWTGQWTYKKNGVQVSENYTFRLDTWEELQDAKGWAMKELPSAEQFPDDSGPQAQTKTVDSVPMCPVHNKPFRKGAYGYFCATKLDDNTWCKRKPV